MQRVYGLGFRSFESERPENGPKLPQSEAIDQWGSLEAMPGVQKSVFSRPERSIKFHPQVVFMYTCSAAALGAPHYGCNSQKLTYGVCDSFVGYPEY